MKRLTKGGGGCFSDSSDGKESAWRPGFSSWVGETPGEGNDYPLQYSCLEHSIDRGSLEYLVVQENKKVLKKGWVNLKGCRRLLNEQSLAKTRTS